MQDCNYNPFTQIKPLPLWKKVNDKRAITSHSGILLVLLRLLVFASQWPGPRLYKFVFEFSRLESLLQQTFAP